MIVIKYLKIRNPTKLNPYHKGFSMKGSRQMEGNWPCSITKPLKYSQSELVARLLLLLGCLSVSVYHPSKVLSIIHELKYNHDV